jgi:uncharacterized protein
VGTAAWFDLLDQSLGFVATVTPDGRRNLSSKGTTTVLDDEHLMFADVASPGTVANLDTNPHLEVNVVDPIARKGYRFKGTTTIHRTGQSFDHALAVFRQRGYTTRRERIRGFVIIEVSDAAPVVSPAYDDCTTERSIVDAGLITTSGCIDPPLTGPRCVRRCGLVLAGRSVGGLAMLVSSSWVSGLVGADAAVVALGAVGTGAVL